ncbi:MAG: DUF4855 domain-containing protein [Clostridia bacterium]|nr:DUF4855 domain-containing protein [Clostridia bacterium]
MKKAVTIIMVCLILIMNFADVKAIESEPHFILVYMDQDYNEGDFRKMSQSGITDFIILSLNNFDHREENYITMLLPRTLYTIQKIIDEVPEASLYIATPHMNSMTHPYYFKNSLEKIYRYFLEIEKSLPEIFDANVTGFYMNTEAIIGEVDYHDLTSNFTVSIMNDLSYRIHEYLHKKFLWIPYYGYGDNAAEIIKRVGYIANTTPFFDYILIQPHYYFDGDSRKNLDAVFYSVINQKICYRDMVPVIEKTSNASAEIGFLNELNSMIRWDSSKTFEKRFGLYTYNFKGLRNSFPSGFYTGGVNDVDYQRIADFYKDRLYSEQWIDLIENSSNSDLF